MAQKSVDFMNVKNVESMEDALDTAELLEKIIGEEEVEKMDGLLSLAITGGDCNWI